MTEGMSVDDLCRSISPTLRLNPAATARAFGERGSAGIARLIHEYCMSDIGSAPMEIVFMGVSFGGVVGMRLADARHVVAKFQPAGNLAHLSRAYEIQELLRRKGVPCATLIRAPREIEPDICAVAHSLFAPGFQRAADSVLRRAIASEYASFLSLTEGLEHTGLHAPQPVAGSDMFPYFPRLKENVVRLWQMDRAIVHTDWKVRNLLFERNRVSAIFDFDALQVRPRLQAVASTAVNFMRGRGPITIRLYPDETYTFLRDFERARGTVFSLEEIRALRVWILYDLIVRASMRAYRNVPLPFIAARMRRFDRRIADLWPSWSA